MSVKKYVVIEIDCDECSSTYREDFLDSGSKIQVQKQTACPHFKPRTWTRPPSCHDCDRKHGEMSDGSVLCSGWPFYKKEGDVPCQNGKMAYGKNLSLF